MTYERTVAAALAETNSKFALAEALALDIPPRRGRTAEDETSTHQYIVEARQAVIAAGGEERGVETLKEYRKTALWVIRERSPEFRWLPGVSYSAHNEARRVNLSYDEFASMPTQTVDAVRQAKGKAGTDGPPEKIAQSWTREQKASVARELLAEPEVADKALNTPEARTPGSAASKAVGNVARATMNRQQAELERTERKIIEDPVSRRIDSNQAINDLGTACERFSREGNEALRRAGELPDGERYWLTGAVDRAEQTLRAVRRYLELGRSEIDAELQALLDSEV